MHTFIIQEQQRIRRASRDRNEDEERDTERPPPPPAAYRSQLYRMRPLNIGKMDVVCVNCGARHWKGERSRSSGRPFNKCCLNGKVKVDLLQEPPAFLKDLFDAEDDRGKKFVKDIRSYNSAFAFSSVRCEAVEQNQSNMPFKIHGQMYHVQGHLTSASGPRARYAQAYLYDSEYGTTSRISNYRKLDDVIIRNLTVLLHEVNQLVSIYKHAFEILSESDNNGVVNPVARIAPNMDVSWKLKLFIIV